MAFRHYEGTVKPASTAWICPSCKSENLGALEAGCAHCSAGKDAGKAKAPPKLEHIDLSGLRARVNAYVDWKKRVRASIPTVLDDALQFAFEAGADWAAENLAAPAGNAIDGVGGTVHPEAAVTGGWMLALIAPGAGVLDAHDVPPREHQTILAALAFYRDNQLAYGAVPGQLDAQEVSKLIEQLSPQEPA